jgi:hypothetical protein
VDSNSTNCIVISKEIAKLLAKALKHDWDSYREQRIDLRLRRRW